MNMCSTQIFPAAPHNFGFNTNMANQMNFFGQQFPTQFQNVPVQYIIPQNYVPVPPLALNMFALCPSPVQHPTMPLSSFSPANTLLASTLPTPTFLTPTPSPPPSYEANLPKVDTVNPPRRVELRSTSVGGAGSQSSEGKSMLREFYSFNVVKQKATVAEMRNRYEQGLVRAMRNALQLPSTEFSIHLSPSKKNKSITIRWILNQEKYDFSSLKQRTTRNDFEKKLVCELAKVDGGSFNSYLSGAKQLTIINEGWSCLLSLKESLISRNGTLNQLLAVPEDQRFEEEAIKNLYKVSEDEKGMALRGPTVVGVRFKLQTDILKMPRFVEKVKAFVGVQRSTMIASLKTHKQYKGWSVYLDVGTPENVRRVEEMSKRFGFEKTRVFVAEDNF